MEIKQFGPEERDRMFYIGSQAFRSGTRDSGYLEDPNKPDMVCYGAYENGRMQARIVIIPYQVHMGAERILPMGGIAGVACLPASRGKGYASALMRFALERMRDAGQCVSTLFPFSHAFYRRYGYEWTGEARRYVAEVKKLPTCPETEQVREATDADFPTMRQLYARLAKQYRGPLVRDDKHWNRLLSDSKDRFTFHYLYEEDGEPQGYLSYRMSERNEENTPNEATWLRQCITLTPNARRAFLGLMKRHEMQVDRFTWYAPIDDEAWLPLSHWELQTQIEPYQMGRVVDVKAALEAWKPMQPVSGAVRMAIVDDTAPWNAGVWQIEAEGQAISLERTAARADIALDIQTFSQAFFGTPSVELLRALGRITVHNEAGYAFFQKLLAGPPNWMNDDF